MEGQKPVSGSWLKALGPGILVAATGVGAGDLMTAGFGGSKVGVALVSAAALGAVLKWFLNEGVARWQMATGTTLLEGWVERLGQWVGWAFLGYLLIWSVFTGGALVNACGVAGSGLLQLTDDPRTSKILWGIVHAAAGAMLVGLGGFRLFERLMSVCIGVMFAAVVVTAILVRPDWSAVGWGLLRPSIPPEGKVWVMGVLGGVGGTVTLLSYGYWIREEGRRGAAGVRSCRIDLAVGYAMTAIFGICMIIIGARAQVYGRGSEFAVTLAGQLGEMLGPAGRWVFLVGFWGAVFSSLLGVWQSVPYLFADFLAIQRRVGPEARTEIDYTRTRGYRIYLVGLTLVSLPLLWGTVEWAQVTYAVMGSLFMPLLALTLLVMNSKARWVGPSLRSGWMTNGVLVATVVFFSYLAYDEARVRLGRFLYEPAPALQQSTTAPIEPPSRERS